MRVHSLINTITFEQQNKGINLFSKMWVNHNHWFVCDFLPINTAKPKNVCPTFSSFRLVLSYKSVTTPLFNNFHDQYDT